MALHLALDTDDILREVFTHLRPPAIPDIGATPKELREIPHICRELSLALSQAARVCKTFHEVAIEALWRTLPNLTVALKLFPTFTLISDEYAEGDQNLYFMFTGDILPEQWERFRHYARFVRIISKHVETYPIQASVYFHLLRHSAGQPLFPSLQKLNWNAMSPQHTDLHLFVTSNLRKLTIWLTYKRDVAVAAGERPALDLLIQISVPQLQGLHELQVFSQEPDIDADAVTWMSIPQLHGLRTLRLEPLSEIKHMGFLAGLAALPHLTELSLTIDSSDRDGFRCIHGFSALEKLTLTEIDSGDLLCPFTSPNLHTLTLTLYAWDPKVVQQLFRMALSPTRYPHLRFLAVELDNDFVEEHPHIPSFHALFGTLPSAPALEEFRIRTPANIVTAICGDRDFARLAEAWPRLRALRLLTTLQGTVSPGALFPFAQHCPELRTLHVRGVDFRDTLVDWVIVPPPPSESEHGLKELGVCLPKNAEDVDSVVSFMRRTFPYATISWEKCCDECERVSYFGFSHWSEIRLILDRPEFAETSDSDIDRSGGSSD